MRGRSLCSSNVYRGIVVDSNTELSKLKAVSIEDRRLAVAAMLIARSGAVIGKAVVLSPQIAVTTAEVAKLAIALIIPDTMPHANLEP